MIGLILAANSINLMRLALKTLREMNLYQS